MEAKVRITGLGGQGIVLAGYILGKAAAIHDDRHALFTQSYGPEARGSACSAQIIISDNPIRYPFIKEQDVLIAMSQEGYDKSIGGTRKGGLVIIDDELVDPGKVPARVKMLKIPAARIAEKTFGKRIVANIVMLGYLTTVTGVVSRRAIIESVTAVVPEGTEQLNSRALNFGLDYEPEVEGAAKKQLVEPEGRRKSSSPPKTGSRKTAKVQKAAAARKTTAKKPAAQGRRTSEAR